MKELLGFAEMKLKQKRSNEKVRENMKKELKEYKRKDYNFYGGEN